MQGKGTHMNPKKTSILTFTRRIGASSNRSYDTVGNFDDLPSTPRRVLKQGHGWSSGPQIVFQRHLFILFLTAAVESVVSNSQSSRMYHHRSASCTKHNFLCDIPPGQCSNLFPSTLLVSWLDYIILDEDNQFHLPLAIDTNSRHAFLLKVSGHPPPKPRQDIWPLPSKPVRSLVFRYNPPTSVSPLRHCLTTAQLIP